MNLNPIRRSQLIAPTGPGALYVLKGGVSVIACGLDYWYHRETSQHGLNSTEFEIREYRLEKLLKVKNFKQPPDFREGDNVHNAGLTIPFHRFPRWHVCSRCGQMEEKRFIDRGRQKCRDCQENGIVGFQQQVMFVAMCEYGHIQDFPWREWVHKTASPVCSARLKYISTGGARLEAQRVRCACGAERSLSGIMSADVDGSTALSKQLDPDGVYFCRGHRPWLGDITEKVCDRHLRGALRSASNVWFGRTHTSIFLPQSEDNTIAELLQMLNTPDIATMINTLASAGVDSLTIGQSLRGRSTIAAFPSEQVVTALGILLGTEADEESGISADEGSDSPAFRATEFKALSKNSKAEPLLIESHPISEYDIDIAKYFTRIGLVNQLRETRVFAGFSRVVASGSIPHERVKELLWKNPPNFDESWLPASVVNGEGLFLQFDEARLSEWENRTIAAVTPKLKVLIDNFEQVRKKTGWKQKEITPRFLLLHTLAHLLINRLTFECGYASASLRERLYVSNSETNPMAGILIYTAAGDSEGTMGGLVRMGKPGYFEPVFRRAIENAEWCSSDPVCRELGAKSGQGPDSCNLAACHSCALLPETSCEEFNRFLDRSLVVDGPDFTGIGFFDISE